MDTLSSRLRDAMGKMQAAEAAALAGVTKQTVYNILDGVTKPDKVRAVTLFDLARALHTSPQWLLYGKDVTTASQSARPDPRILAHTQRFLETAFALQGKTFSLFDNADLFADAFEWFAEDARPVDQRNLVDFGRWLAERQARGETGDGKEGSSSAGKTAGTHRRGTAGAA